MQLAVALAGEEAAGGQALRLLAKRGHRVAVVFSDSDERSRGATVASVADSLGIQVRPATELRDPATAGELRAGAVDLLLNVHSLHIVDAEVVAAPLLGAYNLHPGPLPERAGLNVPSWALYEGDEAHGVTLHRMTAGVDEGPIAFGDRFQIGGSDTALTLMTQCVRRGLGMVERLLELAESGEPIPAHAQDLTRRRWFAAGPPEGGRLGWRRPASEVANFVRACDYGPFPSPWGFPRCSAPETEIGVVTATPLSTPADAPPGTVTAAEGEAVLVAAEDTWVAVERVEVDHRRVAAADVLNPGDRLYPTARDRRAGKR